MSEFAPGDRVQDVCWDGSFVGRVREIGSDGTVYVRWDGKLVDDGMSPNEVVLLERSPA